MSEIENMIPKRPMRSALRASPQLIERTWFCYRFTEAEVTAALVKHFDLVDGLADDAELLAGDKGGLQLRWREDEPAPNDPVELIRKNF